MSRNQFRLKSAPLAVLALTLSDFLYLLGSILIVFSCLSSSASLSPSFVAEAKPMQAMSGSECKCASVSQACFESTECCSESCDADRHMCCVPTGHECVGSDGNCCTGFCDPSTFLCNDLPSALNSSNSSISKPTNFYHDTKN